MSGAQLEWQSDALANHVELKLRPAIDCTLKPEWMRAMKSSCAVSTRTQT